MGAGMMFAGFFSGSFGELRSRNRVQSRTAPGVAARNTPNGEPAALQGAMPAKGLNRIRRTGWIIPAGAGQNGRNQELVASDKPLKDHRHRFSN